VRKPSTAPTPIPAFSPVDNDLSDARLELLAVLNIVGDISSGLKCTINSFARKTPEGMNELVPNILGLDTGTRIVEAKVPGRVLVIVVTTVEL
jgi:hypothetical protein